MKFICKEAKFFGSLFLWISAMVNRVSMFFFVGLPLFLPCKVLTSWREISERGSGSVEGSKAFSDRYKVKIQKTFDSNSNLSVIHHSAEFFTSWPKSVQVDINPNLSSKSEMKGERVEKRTKEITCPQVVHPMEEREEIMSAIAEVLL